MVGQDANKRQVGGEHYQNPLQHWDAVVLFELDYFQGNISKYVFRHKKKNGIQDLEKAAHYLQKYIEIETARKNGTLTLALLQDAVALLEQADAEGMAEYQGALHREAGGPA